ncbi:MAG: peptidylprolyl isomerase [Cellulosilyticaceae bacterium]
MKKISLVLIIVIFILFGLYLGTRVIYASTDSDQNPIATVSLSTGEEFTMTLYPAEAPNTVSNFIYLANIGFYEGTSINRIIPGYLVQAGDPIGNGKGFPGYFIKSECKFNGVKNNLKHKRGTVSMARGDKFDTEGCQFFVLLEDDSHLDGQYSAFATINEGLEVVEKIALGEINTKNQPIENITITSINIETHDIAYDMPSVLDVKEVLAQNE